MHFSSLVISFWCGNWIFRCLVGVSISRYYRLRCIKDSMAVNKLNEPIMSKRNISIFQAFRKLDKSSRDSPIQILWWGMPQHDAWLYSSNRKIINMGSHQGWKKKTDGFEWHPVYEKMIIKLKELHLKKMFKSKKIIKQKL